MPSPRVLDPRIYGTSGNKLPSSPQFGGGLPGNNTPPINYTPAPRPAGQTDTTTMTNPGIAGGPAGGWAFGGYTSPEATDGSRAIMIAQARARRAASGYGVAQPPQQQPITLPPVQQPPESKPMPYTTKPPVVDAGDAGAMGDSKPINPYTQKPPRYEKRPGGGQIGPLWTPPPI